MRIAGAQWALRVNMLLIECECGHKFMHRADRWTVRCTRCGATESLGIIRERYAKNPDL